MKLRISSSKTALFKDLTRFAPVWALYLIGLVLLIIPNVVHEEPIYIARTLEETIGPLGILNFLYGALCAQLLFGDLFQSRLCNALHAMPLKRSDWFFCHIAAGLSFSLMPNTVCALLLMIAMEEYWFIALFWLAAMALQFVFFFGLAVLSMLMVGNRFAMVAVYGILNFLSVLAMWFVKTVVESLLFGFYADAGPFLVFCPIVQLVTSQERGMEYLCFERVSRAWTFSGLGGGWIYLLILAGIGLLFGILALLLYRRRALEAAGDFMAVRPLAPLFNVVYTLTVAALFGAAGEQFLDEILGFFIVGFVVGYFTGQMLLRRTVKVFSGKVFLWFGIFAAVVFGCVALIITDPLGYSRWTPEPSQVAQVKISNSIDMVFSMDPIIGNKDLQWDSHVSLEDGEDIEKILRLHREVTEKKGNFPNQRVTSLRICYTLKNGKEVTRVYKRCVPPQSLAEFFSRPEVVLGIRGDADAFLEGISAVHVEGNKITGNHARELMEAVLADCEEGTMAQNAVYHDFGNEMAVVWVEFETGNGDYRQAVIYSGAKNAVSWLKKNFLLWGDENIKMEDYFRGK